ncbi:MAG: HAMP domain-containing histidine kinase [Geovibrio sp.]|nr:HAMP domain-containing histidine kinase [Geovibrio sp.]
MINLIMNAAEACPENPEISVECSEEEGFAVIKVQDNGHGIPENIKTKVFDPFFTTKEVGKGTGMGLYVTYNIMRLHGGSIEILSEEGKGTEVSVRFPEEACDGGKNTDN